MKTLNCNKIPFQTQKSLESDVKQILQRSKDPHDQFTSFDLCHKIIFKVAKYSDFTGDILVVANLEFLIILLYFLDENGISRDKVWFSSPCKYKRRFAEAYGIKTLGYLLEEDMSKQFDIIIGNPPFQSPNNNTHNSAFWPKFIGKSYSLLSKNGILAYICPSSWSRNEKDYITSFADVSVTTVRNRVFNNGWLINAVFGKKVNSFFSEGVDFSYFIFQKNMKGNTLIENDFGEIQIDYENIPFIPTNINKILISILEKTLWNNKIPKLKLVNNGKEIFGFRNGSKNISSEKENKFKYPIVNTSAQYSKKQYLYSNIQQDISKERKIIFSDSGYAKPFYDDGIFGLGHHARAIYVKDEKEANVIINFLQSNLIKFLTKTQSASGISVDFSKIINYIPYCDSFEIYKYFNLSEEEINFIERGIK